MNQAFRANSSLAVISLITGILGWTLLPFLGSVAAIITGHMARAEIRRDPERLLGDGMAVAGLILGWASIVLWLVGILVFILFFGGLVWLASNS